MRLLVPSAEVAATRPLLSCTLFSFVLSTLVLVSTIGCVHNKRFQPSDREIVPTLANGTPGFPTAVIEFDDMGELWDRCSLSDKLTPCQLNTALNYIRDQRLLAQSQGQDAVVITFIHGWRNNAESSNENLLAFSGMVGELQEKANNLFKLCQAANLPFDRSLCPLQPSHFIAVYLGWRGQVARTPFDYVTVFDREMAAKRTALVSMSEVLIRIRNAAKRTVKDDPALPAQRARFLLFGHSFGGLIVERAMSQMLISSLVPEHRSDADLCTDGSIGVRPFADLVFLINPATDAVETTQLIDLMKRSHANRCFPISLGDVSPPMIVAIHARNDTATGWVFATGHFLEQANKSFRPSHEPCDFCNSGLGKPPSEGALFRHTPGNEPYLTNFCYINREPTGDPVCEQVKKEVQRAKTKAGFDPSDTRSVFDLMALTPSVSVNKITIAQQATLLSNLKDLLAVPVSSLDDLHPDQKPMLNIFRRRLPDSPDPTAKTRPWNDTPYWIFTVPKAIVDNHGGFWSIQFTDLITGLVLSTTPPGGTSFTLN